MMSTSGAGWRLRDSEADVETRVFERPPPFALDRTLILQIMRELEPLPGARPGARPLSMPVIPKEPKKRNVFLTPPEATDPPPPWEQPWVHTAPVTTKRPIVVVRVEQRRTLLPWFAAVMLFGIAFGVLQDPVLRERTRGQITSAAKDTYRYSEGAVARVASWL